MINVLSVLGYDRCGFVKFHELLRPGRLLPIYLSTNLRARLYKTRESFGIRSTPADKDSFAGLCIRKGRVRGALRKPGRMIQNVVVGDWLTSINSTHVFPNKRCQTTNNTLPGSKQQNKIKHTHPCIQR